MENYAKISGIKNKRVKNWKRLISKLKIQLMAIKTLIVMSRALFNIIKK